MAASSTEHPSILDKNEQGLLGGPTPSQPPRSAIVPATEGREGTNGVDVSLGRVTDARTTVNTAGPGVEVKLDALQALEKKSSLLSDATATLGVAPALEESLFSKIEEAFDLRLDSWKVKIEEGLTSNSETIVLHDNDDDKIVEIKVNKVKRWCATLNHLTSGPPPKRARVLEHTGVEGVNQSGTFILRDSGFVLLVGLRLVPLN
ncbi:hypothetical protein MJO28_014471 [Puccinia striiformis f. sp. tritici]|uniref:Uncharacterized protein n=1 Tax=Puccinia striiformis f. sp. tritici TaxID=168172 RepID=A0ACC0DTU9_9BASI|nr:hypothetical protein MJO28_014471 [Puccinia striiformis f. sp. tritici]KAI7939599.1 hypothetical protein MJO29_014335 [Puccinia striiformis f. sp. tritici]